MNAPEQWSTRVLTDFQTLQQLSPEWTELWGRCPGVTPFQRPEWLLSWTQAFRPRVLCVIEVRRAGALAGLAPLFLYGSGNERILAPLGAGVSDYLDWLIDPVENAAILERIFDGLRNSIPRWDRLELTDLPHSSYLLRVAFDDWDCERSIENACPVLSLPRTAKSVEEVLPSKQRHNLRTARRRIAEAGQVQVEIANRETLDELLAAMMRLHGARWEQCGTAGVLADHAVQEFNQFAGRALLERGILRLYGLRFNGQLIATLYALAEQEIVFCYLQGFDPAYRWFSPGAQILAAVIEDAMRGGKTAVDFLRGRETYKYAWGGRDQETFRLCVRGRERVQQPVAPAIAA
jgi:CelD/BcsL family acetyltransferase involved in cellulose biosynthesis